ncbi:hypothetical protein Srot_2619 [Segniliparus rotundus DSM 44985]|uniref:Calpain catalytic domain-containing protein n=1 Tax=Segniliparus rotundus (strain ATCC BAA-972 / CDC 1076 / CIP 108378 / DSM 44985 / JCM 13578) TaxID=640132 RepID=D6ZC85_SEGRD|nr:C2 family cysteine protease [Segniliparus rotundus]ADG99054.1 hypothetical protein Srot_2619 [Segniliparus rotundus DSM 44985]
MTAFRKSALALVVAAGVCALFVSADKLPANAAIRSAPAPLAAAATSTPATADQQHFTAANLWSSAGPSPEDIRQKNIGDCYFDSTLAAVAFAQPERIVRAISFDPDIDVFTVRLYDYAEGRDYIPGTHGDGNPWPAGTPVTPTTIAVTQHDIQEDIHAAGASSVQTGTPGYIWPAVMEAAYAKLLDGEYARYTDVKKFMNPVELGLKIAEASNEKNPLWAGGDVDQGMASVTGETGSYVPAALSSYDAIASAIAERRPVTMGTRPSTQTFQDRLVFNHQYTVLGIAKNANGEVTLTVRNPWGTNEGVPGVPKPSDASVAVDLRQALADKVIGSFDIGPLPR